MLTTILWNVERKLEDPCVSPSVVDPMDCSTPGLPIHRQLPELLQDGGKPGVLESIGSQRVRHDLATELN